MKQPILIDTNALITMAQEGLDLFSLITKVVDKPIQILVLQATIDELDVIEEEQRGRFARAAVLAKKIIKAKEMQILNEVGYVDDLLVKHAQEGALILTQDKELKERLAKPYLTIRQRKYVTLIK